jgi:hypothetical protein
MADKEDARPTAAPRSFQGAPTTDPCLLGVVGHRRQGGVVAACDTRCGAIEAPWVHGPTQSLVDGKHSASVTAVVSWVGRGVFVSWAGRDVFVSWAGRGVFVSWGRPIAPHLLFVCSRRESSATQISMSRSHSGPACRPGISRARPGHPLCPAPTSRSSSAHCSSACPAPISTALSNEGPMWGPSS